MADKPSYYSPEAKKARQDELRDLVTKRNDAEERLRNTQQDIGSNNRFREINTFEEGGSVEARQARIPRDMRPRSTPNAELNAQQRDQWRYDEGIYDRPVIKPLPMRGYEQGGKVQKHGSSTCVTCKDKFAR